MLGYSLNGEDGKMGVLMVKTLGKHWTLFLLYRAFVGIFLMWILKIRRSHPPFSYVLIFNSHRALKWSTSPEISSSKQNLLQIFPPPYRSHP